MKLSKNFTLSELVATSTGVKNKPTPEAQANLYYLAQCILQPIRDEWGRIKVTSGYRSLLVNKTVGGSINSDHLEGKAGDIQSLDSDIGVVFDWIVTKSNIVFGQAILEKRGNIEWIHISLPRHGKKNREAFQIVDGVPEAYDV